MQKSKANNMAYIIIVLFGFGMIFLTLSNLFWAIFELQNINFISLMPALFTGSIAAFAFAVAFKIRPYS